MRSFVVEVAKLTNGSLESVAGDQEVRMKDWAPFSGTYGCENAAIGLFIIEERLTIGDKIKVTIEKVEG